MEALRLHWRQQREEMDFWRLVTNLERLSMRDMDKEMLEESSGMDIPCQEEKMVVVVSLFKEPPNNGGVYTLVQKPPTIPKKGLEGVPVFGLHTTEGDGVTMNMNDKLENLDGARILVGTI